MPRSGKNEEPVAKKRPGEPVPHGKSTQRHKSQRSIIAAKSESFEAELEEEAKKRQIRKPLDSVKDTRPEPIMNKGQTRDQLGRAFGVSGRSVERAKIIINKSNT